jgi:hypothetical protein
MQARPCDYRPDRTPTTSEKSRLQAIPLRGVSCPAANRTPNVERRRPHSFWYRSHASLATGAGTTQVERARAAPAQRKDFAAGFSQAARMPAYRVRAATLATTLSWRTFSQA